jgi:hypothetical protein
MCHFLSVGAKLNISAIESVTDNLDNRTRYQTVWTVVTVLDSYLPLGRRPVHPRVNPTLGLLPGDQILGKYSSIVFSIFRPLLLVLRMLLFV